MEQMDFPRNPKFGQIYTNAEDISYQWDGQAWVVGLDRGVFGDIRHVAGLLNQVRILLQDTDLSSGGYRYSTASLVVALNQAIMDMFRIRPDLFLENDYTMPYFGVGNMEVLVGVEAQYIPPLIYYVTGLVQARDDEQNQDARAMGFLKIFQQTIVTGALA